MFQGVKNGGQLVKEGIRIFSRHPEFLVPLLFTWCIYAPTILYLKYGLHWDALTLVQTFVVVFGVIFLFALVLSLSCSVLLELIQQHESGLKMNWVKSFADTFRQNMLKIIPLVLVWTILWAILLILEAIFSKEEKEKEEKLTVEEAARTLAGYGKWSFSEAFFEAIQRGIRMIIFLILPAIAWDNLQFSKAAKKGVAVFKTNLSEFVSGFILTEMAACLVFLPPALLFWLSDEFHVKFPDPVWLVTILYSAFAWSFSIYLEQMFSAELYLWHRKWEKKVESLRDSGKPLPSMKEVPMPSVLDEVHEFLN